MKLFESDCKGLKKSFAGNRVKKSNRSVNSSDFDSGVYMRMNSDSIMQIFKKSSNYKNNFTYSGLDLIVDYFEEMGEPTIFSVADWSVQFTEYDSLRDIVDDTGIEDDLDMEEGEDLEDYRDEIIDMLQDKTVVLTDGKVIVIGEY